MDGGDASRDGDFDGVGVGKLDLRFADGQSDAFGEEAGGFEVGAGKKAMKFFATKPANDVAAACDRFEHMGERGKDLVANEVAVGVVHALEVVEVEDDDAHGLPTRQPFAEHLVFGGFDGAAAMQEAGELVVFGEMSQRFDHCFELMPLASVSSMSRSVLWSRM